MRTSDHYDNISEVYEELWFYSEDFVNHISEQVIDLLFLKSSDFLVDLGCGSGIYSENINKKVNFSYPVVGVDPSRGMVDEVKKKNGILAVNDDAMGFTNRSLSFDKVLIKEVIHHVEKNKWNKIFRNIHDNLSSDGRLLLLMLPPKIEYPLFDKAIKKYEQNQPHFEEVAQEYRNVGFDTTTTFVSHELNIKKDRYMSMVESRYMSLLSDFNEEELKEGIEEIREKHGEVLTFEDKFAAVLGEK